MPSSEQLGLLLDQAQDKIVLLDDGGTFTYVNEATRRILGFAPDELLGENAFDFIHPDDTEAVRRSFYRTIQNESFTEVTVEYRHRTSDESWVWLESRMSNLTDSILDGFVVSSRDITERIQAEQRHQETASRLEGIAAVSGDVLWMFNADWSELLFVNPAYETIYGMPLEELKADPGTFLDTIHPDDVPAVKDAMTCLSRGNSIDMEYRVNPAEEYDRWVWVQGEPITRDGEVVRIAGFTRDITDRRQRERQLIVMDNLLRHNLRNDLNVILGTVDLIEEEVPETAERTALIRQTGEGLLETAQKEREIIELITGPQHHDVIDLQATVSESVETIRGRYPHTTIEIGALEAVSVRGRPELKLTVTELLENAVQHSDAETPRIRIDLRRTGQSAELRVEDNATPLPPVEADVLTGDHEMDSVYHSSGLGLWLVYWSVKLSNGDITVQSKTDRGNRIIVTLPRDFESRVS